VTAHAVSAAKAFFRSIALGRTRLKAYILQDLLRLLAVWFHHGEAPAVRRAIAAGLDTGAVSNDVWLQVIPQLIARIHMAGRARRGLLLDLLRRIGASHPQALIYPLTVALKSSQRARSEAAEAVMASVRFAHPRLVEQADVVSNELIRVAILWPELWHSALEEASRVFFGEGNERAFLALLLPLHERMVSPGPQTQREVAFLQAFGQELETALGWLRSYKRRLDAGVDKKDCAGDAAAAWDAYYSIFRKINKGLNQEMSLELPLVSPRLLAAHDLELGVPGTYTAGAPVVRIMALCPSIDVIASKQRPRKTTMQGSDGRQYTFLLKGHEDLRQDERVMQLFGLVNTLISNDYETSRRDLSIRRYAVTPLSHSAGVVGWVPNTDTLHALIREHRDSRKVLLNIEHRLMCQMAPTFDHLTMLQKVEVFRHALDSTEGKDLAKVLWLKSASSEVWLERRTNYTRSLAVMSIVGYVLGLGDRHPSNLLLDRVSGKVLHIDFGE
jgi:FKBP12-rapamycin complex-associated protein